LLSNRCIGDTSIVESEGALISKLKGMYGVEYVSKLQKMYSDILINKDLKDKFKAFCEHENKTLGVDCTARVLTVGAWPLRRPSENFTFSPPKELVGPMKIFEDWYKSQKSGIELNWLHQFSKSELRFNVRSNDTYTFLLGDDFLLAVLLQLNSIESLTLIALREITQLQQAFVNIAVKTLLKNKVLLLNGVEFDDKMQLQDSSSLSVNKKFSNKRKRLTIASVGGGGGKDKTQSTNPNEGGGESSGGIKEIDSVEPERKIKIQAAIVRIMKTRKELNHQNLISEVFNQLKTLFSPQPRMVKQCIQLLIEKKDYLERKPQSNDVYLYKA